MSISIEEARKLMSKKKKKNKYNAKPKFYKGVRYHSTFEAQYAEQLDIRKKCKDPTVKVLQWWRQVPYAIWFHDEHITTYYLDFKYTTADGKTHFVDCKSKATYTDLSKLKIKMVEIQYNINIRIVMKNSTGPL